MHWIIQREVDCVWPVWRSELLRRGLPCDVVRVVPFTKLCIPEVRPAGQVICLGSSAGHDDLARVGRERGWRPNMWTDNLDPRIWNDKLGTRMLNCGAVCSTLGEAVAGLGGEIFLRPLAETKAFNGVVLKNGPERSRAEEYWWREEFPKLRPELEVLVAPVAEIEAEFRFFVVRGRVVTGSRYRREDKWNWSGEVPAEERGFAQAIADQWGPGDAYVIDVARSAGVLKVVEFNCWNASALYGCDAGAVIDSIERGFGPKAQVVRGSTESG